MKALIWSGTPKAYPPKEIDPENLAGETWHLVFVVGTKSIRAVAVFYVVQPLYPQYTGPNFNDYSN